MICEVHVYIRFPVSCDHSLFVITSRSFSLACVPGVLPRRRSITTAEETVEETVILVKLADAIIEQVVAEGMKQGGD